MQCIYDKISTTFDKTRHHPWPSVVNFLKSLPPNSKVLDIGCGNGRHLSVRQDCEVYGCDISEGLINIAKKKNPTVEIRKIKSATSLPYPDNYFDAVICIAVLHHIKFKNERDKAMTEINRVVKTNGAIMITLWSTDAIKDSWYHICGNDYYVPWNGNLTIGEVDRDIHLRFYHMYSHNEVVLMKQLHNFNLLNYEAKNWHLIRK